MSRGKSITTFLAVLVVNFAVLNVFMSSRCAVHTVDGSTGKVPTDFVSRRSSSEVALSDEVVLSYLKRRQMSGTVHQMKIEMENMANEQRPAVESEFKGGKPGLESSVKLSPGQGASDVRTRIIATPSSASSAGTSTLTAWANVTTLGFYEGRLFSGFRNQIMCFTIVILEALRDGHGQVLLESLPEKDTYGSNKLIPFNDLWDVAHWNSHYPQLPRLVQFHPVLHDQFNPATRRWYRHDNGQWTDVGNVTVYESPTRPKPFGQQHKLLSAYMRYAKGNGPYTNSGHRSPAEILMLQGAMRPHQKLRTIIDSLLHSLEGGSANGKEKIDYMTLHARVEPDMQRQMVCVPKKVLNLTDIFDWIQTKWPEPPAHHIFMPINRDYLEQEGSEEAVLKLTKKNKPVNWIAVENLRALNRARDEGLWAGRAKVFEFGSKALKDTEYRDRPSTTGALVNFFIGVGAKLFIGTEVSSYSHDLLATRFYRGNMENYKYLPDGLHHWTPPGLDDPPGFGC